MSITYYGDREKCYRCYRPKSSCMCPHINQIKTKTKFVVLMHPKEFKKIKNGTGHLTHLSLENSELFVGVDFSNHTKVNQIIKDYESYILYPSKDAINLTNGLKKETDKDIAIFLIDSTWACSVKMLAESKNLKALKHISFTSTKLSQFKIKEQPKDYCLSTIESTQTVIELLHKSKIENLSKKEMDDFLIPFHKMVDYQLSCVDNFRNVRFL